MQSDYISVPPFWSVGQTIDYMREEDGLPNDFTQIWVVDPAHHLFGRVPLDRLLRSKRPITIEEITDASNEQTTGVGEVYATVSQMDEMTQQNAAMADRSAAAARSLAEQSETLVELVRFFTTRDASDLGARTGEDQQAWDRDARAEAEAARKAISATRPALAANGDWSEF